MHPQTEEIDHKERLQQRDKEVKCGIFCSTCTPISPVIAWRNRCCVYVRPVGLTRVQTSWSRCIRTVVVFKLAVCNLSKCNYSEHLLCSVCGIELSTGGLRAGRIWLEVPGSERLVMTVFAPFYSNRHT